MLCALIGDIVGSRFEFNNINTKEFELLTMKDFEGYLSAYEIPKRIYLVEAIPQTDNGKVKRVDCRKLAESLLKNS